MSRSHGNQLSEYQQEEKVISSYNYFCVFCLRLTLMDNLGNFGRCQECKIEGSNHASTCSRCRKQNQYVYKTEQNELVCAQCTGKTLWSGESEVSKDKTPCAVCLKETAKKQYSIAQECTSCQAIQIPSAILKLSKCPSCPPGFVRAEDEQLNFFIIEGELKCEGCAISASFQNQISQLRQNQDDVDPALALPDTYKYFCVECKEVTDWRNNGDKTSSCRECGLQGTNTKQRCVDCHEKGYLYLGEFKNKCAECASGYGPKGVSDIMPLSCLFCADTLQTWYIFREKGKMRCTNCQGLRPIQAPLIPEQCPSCFRLFESGLQEFSGLKRCDECFRTQLAKVLGTTPEEEAATDDRAPAGNQKPGKRTYMYDCELCQSNQVWVNMGQFSQCEGCKVVGTHSGDLQCSCGEYDFLYTFPSASNESDNSFDAGEAKCSVCIQEVYEQRQKQN